MHAVRAMFRNECSACVYIYETQTALQAAFARHPSTQLSTYRGQPSTQISTHRRNLKALAIHLVNHECSHPALKPELLRYLHLALELQKGLMFPIS